MRRGKDAASINGLAFSRDSKWLCASSDRGTVHVFDLAAPTASDGSGGLLHYIGSTGVLGSGVSEYSKGHFSKAQIHGVSPACLCAFGSAPGQVLVADMDGVFAIYLFDPAKGGEARIERRFLFARGDDDGGG
jgi:WD40 repeat protein